MVWNVEIGIKLRVDSRLHLRQMFHHFLDVIYYLQFSCFLFFLISIVLFFCCFLICFFPPPLPLPLPRYTAPPAALLFFNRHPEPLTDVAVLCLSGAALIVRQMSDNFASWSWVQ